MGARHAGESQVADQALLDQVRACAEEMRVILSSPVSASSAEYEAYRHHMNRWCGRAWWLLEQIGKLAE